MTNDKNLDRFLDRFLDRYATKGRIVADIEVPTSDSTTQSPFIVLRYGDKTVIVNPIGLGNHLCVDLHSFVDGEDATAGVFGMSDGKRWSFDKTGTKSHGWPSASLVVVLVGEQTTEEV